jgi:DNA (cytosine-5)-methyltransferase 1
VSRDITEGGETGQRIATDAERSSGAAGEYRVKGGRTTAGGSDVTSTLFAAYGTAWNGNSGALTGDHFVLEDYKEPQVADAEGSAGAAGELVLNDQGGSVMGVSYGVTGTLRAQTHGHQPIVAVKSYGFEPGIAKREGNPNRFSENLCPTLRAKMGDNQAAVAYSLQGNMIGRADHNGPQGSGVNEDVSFTLNTVDRHAVCYGISAYESNSMKSSNPHSGIYKADTSRTIDQNGGNPACNQGGIAVVHTYSTQSYSEVKESEQGASLKASGGVYGGGSENFVVQQVVRRLTPLECERLQGYPDGWTALDHEDKAVSDTQRYKALGNSFAVPNALFVISRCVKQLQKEEVNERD